MQTTTLLEYFLFFVCVTVIANTVIIISIYYGFSVLTSKVTDVARKFDQNSPTRQWIDSLAKVAEQAVHVTEVAKQGLAELDPALQGAQSRYGFVLAQIDTKIERFAVSVSSNAQRVQDAVERPVNKFSAVASGLKSVLSAVVPADQED